MVDVFDFLKKHTRVEVLKMTSQGQQQLFTSKIKDVFDDKILLSKPHHFPREYDDIALQDKLKVIFCTEDGILSGNATFLNKSTNQDEGIFISFPYNTQFCQRRENTRIPMHVDFEIKLDEILTLKTKNISGKGLACITDKPLPDFWDTQIIIHLPETDICTVARKVYSKEIFTEAQPMFLNGLEFTEISDKDTDIIVKCCLKFQLNSKHNERLFETL